MVPCIFHKLEHLDRTSIWIPLRNLLAWVSIGQINWPIRPHKNPTWTAAPFLCQWWPDMTYCNNQIQFHSLWQVIFSIFAQRRNTFSKIKKYLIEDEIRIFYLNRFGEVIQPKKSSSPPWEISLNFRRTQPISSIKGRFIMQNAHIMLTLQTILLFNTFIGVMIEVLRYLKQLRAWKTQIYAHNPDKNADYGFRLVRAVLNWIMSYSHLVRPVRTRPPYSRTINRTNTLTFANLNFKIKNKLQG